MRLHPWVHSKSDSTHDSSFAIHALASFLNCFGPPARGLRAAKRIEVDGGWIGRGYGHATDDGRRAVEVAARGGLVLDATYTAKAFACALARREREVLFWHTLSTAPLEPLLGDGAATPPLPSAIAALLR